MGLETDTEGVKGPLWRPGDGVRAFFSASSTWIRDHRASSVFWLAAGALITWATEALVSPNHGLLRFSLSLAAILFLGVTLPRLLWMRAQLQRPYEVRPRRRETGSWW